MTKVKALVRTLEDGTTEVKTEPFSKWTQDHLLYLLGKEPEGPSGDGWTLVEDYELQEEDQTCRSD